MKIRETVTEKKLTLRDAQREIEATGSLGPETYWQVADLIQRALRLETRCDLDWDKPSLKREGLIQTAPKIDEEFLRSLRKCIETYQIVADVEMQGGENLNKLYIAAHALPDEKELKKFVWYDKVQEKKFDRALQGLLKAQER
jgi:hypothetical protein